jgi:DNA-binding NtrC family response regulator
MNRSTSILVVDDDAEMAGALADLLCQQGHNAQAATSAAEAEPIIARSPHLRLVLIDLVMPEVDGMLLLERVKKQKPELAVLMMSGFATIAAAVEAMKRGAEDFITKPFEQATICKKINGILELQSLRERVANLESSLRPPSFQGMVTQSPKMLRALQLAKGAARADVPVLLVGEPGTGKEMLAGLIHRNSQRAARRFIPVHCGSLPEDLVESELFGHRSGAGVQQDRPGLLVAAAGGTLLLDEISEMPPDIKVKLLLALEEGRVRPLGAVEQTPIDVHVIAATSCPIRTTADDTLRHDPYFRLARITIELPPLRKRREDLPLLIDHFLSLYAPKYGCRPIFHPRALKLLHDYPFPGNVRELENLVEGVMATHRRQEVIRESDLRPRLSSDLLAKEAERFENVSMFPLVRMEKCAIEQVLRFSRNNKSRASEILGISRDSLYRKMKQYEVPL